MLEGGIVERVHGGRVDKLNFKVVGGTVVTSVGLRWSVVDTKFLLEHYCFTGTLTLVLKEVGGRIQGRVRGGWMEVLKLNKGDAVGLTLLR